MSQWSEQRRHDHYYKEAKKQGYRARSSFKLIQIHNRYGVFRPNDVVIDLGASPGGWSQIAADYARLIVAVDIESMQPIDKVVFVKGDITEPETINKIRNYAPRANVVLSDASPDISGHYTMDQAKSVWLCENALKIARETLIEGGVFLCKIFEESLAMLNLIIRHDHWLYQIPT